MMKDGLFWVSVALGFVAKLKSSSLVHLTAMGGGGCCRWQIIWIPCVPALHECVISDSYMCITPLSHESSFWLIPLPGSCYKIIHWICIRMQQFPENVIHKVVCLPNNVMFTGYYPGLSSSLWIPHHYRLRIIVSLSHLLLIWEIGCASQRSHLSQNTYITTPPPVCIYATTRSRWKGEEGCWGVMPRDIFMSVRTHFED